MAEQGKAAANRVTRADVARYAGVSTAVVSYVVNGGPRPVAPETQRRVREALEVLNYRPNLSARALKMGSSDTIGLILADSLNPFFAEFTLAIAQAAEARGHRLLIADSRSSRDTERELVEDLLARQVDGLLFATSTVGLDPMAGLRLYGVPSVLIDSAGPVPGRTTIGPGAADGAATLVRHLVQVHGRTRIALAIGAEGGFGDPDPRTWGWQTALGELGLPKGPLVSTRWSREGGYRAGLELLKSDPLPDAVFACSDLMAVGLLRALHEAGVSVPGDVAVVSFDGTAESEFSWPPLTVMRQPIQEMAQAAVDLIDSTSSAPAHHEFPMELIVRASCGCPPMT
jgi:LacI family transcriptional regulator